jgi:alanyl-tRNA synthetase
MGAMALFSEKYEETVRVVQFGDVSIELCGGKHVENTGNIGLFKINSETGSAAGIRRIDASVGFEVLKIIDELHEKIEETKHKHIEEVKALRQEIKKAKTEGGSAKNADAKSQEINGITVHSVLMSTSDSDILKNTADNLKNQSPDCVVAVGGADSEGVKFVVSVSDSAIAKGAHAGNIIREIAQIAGGRGGGKPNFAQAGGADSAKVAEALEKVFELVK